MAAGKEWAPSRSRPMPERTPGGTRRNALDGILSIGKRGSPGASVRNSLLAANVGIAFMTVRVAVSWQ